MSLSADYCTEKKGDRGGGGGGAALAHQRKLIWGLLVWVTLLTLGLGASITLHFIQSKLKQESPGNETQQKSLMVFTPWDLNDKVGLLKWRTMYEVFISGKDKLMVKEDGQYFLYLQVTLHPNHKGNHTITLQSEKGNEILKGVIDGSKLSSAFMANGIPLEIGDILTVTCDPEARIQDSATETYLGVIKLT
ncbi:hypothetical protein QQF64_025328 [Cirrhinus molitorella]|uniref:Uncharacterized protein n=2 Tax=Cirrhinus molitorella TaxID=172907 RepID=A0AA88QKL8_9TELE|nr:hypothetical protein Q8A67_001113 [Cirrhinus molitorella]